MAGAAEAGLRLDPAGVSALAPVNVTVATGPLDKVGWIYRATPWLVNWRAGPDSAHQLHDSARLRATLVDAYRPRSLQRVLPMLFR